LVLLYRKKIPLIVQTDPLLKTSSQAKGEPYVTLVTVGIIPGMVRMALIAWIVALTLGAGGASALAQNAPPFFGGGVVAYDPTISTVNAGAVFDATAVVSHDRKYVTIGGQAQQSSVIALRNFPVVSGVGQGFVGGVDPGAAGGGGGFSTPLDATPTSPEQILRNGVAARSILSQRGMFLLRD